MRRSMALVEKTSLEKQEAARPDVSALIGGTGPAQSRPSGARCKACQLQLCKGRGEAPHAALTESPAARDSSRSASDTAFVCKTCGITMVHSADLSRPGWHHAR